MSTSRLAADLGILAKNALRDGASFQKFKRAVGIVLPDIPDVLPPPSDPDGILDRACALFSAFHIFETNTTPVTPEMLAESMALIVALLPALLGWITAFTGDIIITNKASEYTHDFHRISVQFLLDVVHDRYRPDVMRCFNSVRIPPGNHLFVVHVVPDLLLHHAASISRPDSVDVLAELCELLVILTHREHGHVDAIVKRLATSPAVAVYCFNRVAQDALQRLRAAQDGAAFQHAVHNLGGAYACMFHCCPNPRFHSVIFDPTSLRRATEVVGRVVRRYISVVEDSQRSESCEVACSLYSLLLAIFEWAIMCVGKEAVLLILRHSFIPNILQFHGIIQDARIPLEKYTPFYSRLDIVFESLALYLCYSSVLKEAERMRKSVLELGLDWTQPTWHELCQKITAHYTSMGAVPSICDAIGCPERENTVMSARCSGCQISWYCSRQCQRTHWISGHRTLCSSFQQYRIDSQGGVQTEIGFLTPKETAHLSTTIHDLVRRGNYPVHQPGWILTLDFSKLVLDVKYGPADDAWRDSVGQRFSTHESIMNSLGIIVFLLLPHGVQHPHFECCTLLTPEWIQNPTATYLPELACPLKQPSTH